MMNVIKTLMISLIWMTSTSVFAEKRVIGEAEFGEEWPFTVSEGILECSKRKIITFTTTDGVTYGVNGTAKNFDYPDIEPIWKINTPMLEELAEAFGQTVEEVIGDDPPPRISIGPIIKAGLELCD